MDKGSSIEGVSFKDLVTHPDATVDECSRAIDKSPHKKFSNVTIATVRSDFRSLTRIFKERGFFKDDVNVGTFA